MSLFTVQQTIKAHLTATLNWDVYSGGIEEAQTLSATGGVLRPHVVLRFGSPQPYLADKNFGGPRHDGLYSNVDAMCIAATDDVARELAAVVADILRGFDPGPEAGRLTDDFGGGTFTVVSENSRPQFLIAWVPFRFLYNLQPE